MKKILLVADTILPISSPPLKNSAVLVVNGKIRGIGVTTKMKKENKGVQLLELGRGILMPGFINAHTHLELGWVQRKIKSFSGFTSWLRQIISAKRGGISNEEIQDSVRDGIRALIRSGVTTVGEVSSYGGIDAPILKEYGIRTVLFKEVLDSRQAAADFDNFERTEIFEERLFPHAPYSCTPELLEKSLISHKKSLTPLGIHLAESPDEIEFVRRKSNGFEREIFPLIDKKSVMRVEADTPFLYLKGLGFFDSTKITTVHMVHVNSDEVKEIKENDVGVVLCPRSNMFLQVGIPPVGEYSELQRVGLGTDSLSSNYNLDFFEEVRALHMLTSNAIGRESAFKTVYTATLGGAKALFLENKIGSIEEGKDADLIFLNSQTGSGIDPYLSVICSTCDNLEFLMVRGKTIFENKSAKVLSGGYAEMRLS